jgi:hypothetical protein
MDLHDTVSVEPKEEKPDVPVEDTEEACSTPSVIDDEKEIGDVAPPTPDIKDKPEEDDEESDLEEQPPSPKKTSEKVEKQDSPKKSEDAEKSDEKKVKC